MKTLKSIKSKVNFFECFAIEGSGYALANPSQPRTNEGWGLVSREGWDG